jgi:CRP-like cAMP-binding protein
MQAANHDASHNGLLSRLPSRELELVRPHLKRVSLEIKEEVSGVGNPIRYIHFPLSAAISLMDMQPSGRTGEVAVVGKEGCTGSHFLDGIQVSPARTLVQVAGEAFRLPVSALPRLLPQIPCFARMARRFNAMLFRHAVISAGCSQHHSAEQRIGRWLLAHHHRTGQSTFAFTHDFIAEQIGVQRVTVTDALAIFERTGVISAGYGKVELCNVKQMEKLTCECFDLALQAIDNYISDIQTYTSGGNRR